MLTEQEKREDTKQTDLFRKSWMRFDGFEIKDEETPMDYILRCGLSLVPQGDVRHDN